MEAHRKQGSKTTSIQLPDMFVSFMARTPEVNPYYPSIKRESETWLSEVGEFEKTLSRVVSVVDFSYFCAVVIPGASADALRALCDWGNWIFPFDDAFDNGLLQNDPAEAQKMVDGLMSVLNDPNAEPTLPLLRAFKSICCRISNAPEGMRRRFKEYMQTYCEASMEQVNAQTNGKILTVEELIRCRRGSIASTPIYSFVEYAYDLDLSDSVMKHPVILRLQDIVTDIVLIQNDTVSYLKEQVLGESHNIVVTYISEGMSLQKAFDTAGELLLSRYRNWYLTLAELPSWGEEIDRQIHQYLSGVHNVALANLNWSFRTDRYWYGRNEEVRRTRKVDLMIPNNIPNEIAEVEVIEIPAKDIPAS